MFFFYFFLETMEDTFALENKNGEVLDVPDVEGFDVVLTKDFNGDTSQLWIFRDSRIIWAERSHLCLGFEVDKPVKLYSQKVLGQNQDSISSKWSFKPETGVIESINIPSLFLSSNESGTLLASSDPPMKWTKKLVKMARPASSCHLKYILDKNRINFSDKHHWTLECSVQVEDPEDCTYFCVIGFYPGGYSGIQQLPGGQRVAIFSVWNCGHNSVEAIEAGADVEVSEFGGEGTGIKSMKHVDWKTKETVTFRIEAERIDGYHFVTCHFMIKETKYLMAKLKRKVSDKGMLTRSGFYSFIEDWNRDRRAEGWKKLRSAKFFNPVFTDLTIGKRFQLDQALFTKVETGADAFAADYARAFPVTKGFHMQTGREPVVTNNTIIKCL